MAFLQNMDELFVIDLLKVKTNHRIHFQKMTFKCHQPVEIQDYRVRFCENLQFDAEINRIEFDAHYLRHKLKKINRH